MNTICWRNGKIQFIDQTRLPHETVVLETDDYQCIVAALKTLQIRGAPAIGVAAAYAVAAGAAKVETDSPAEFLSELDNICRTVASARPTAVNLFWAIERMRKAVQGETVAEMKASLLAEAKRMEAEDAEVNRKIGRFGAELIPDGATVLTHCNAGALATVTYGTALGVIRAAKEQGKTLQVYADETRPLLQGARLTAWELMQDNIPVTLITDNMAGHFLHKGVITCAIVGADRIAANGDVANKIGTYSVAVLAAENGVPFYVAAPTSTIDMALATGDEIPIEERSPEEVTCIGGVRVAPEGVAVANPAFDVTPHHYVSAIITEKGVAQEPYVERLREIIGGSS
ncbi:MAG: S-methyl-5-thioribose-1-phosphate isomerase [Chloroflexi bacterium]|nr:S-methyl-5-thioribose-1-phosphate isomerase [Chloroflexota bacterium]